MGTDAKPLPLIVPNMSLADFTGKVVPYANAHGLDISGTSGRLTMKKGWVTVTADYEYDTALKQLKILGVAKSGMGCPDWPEINNRLQQQILAALAAPAPVKSTPEGN